MKQRLNQSQEAEHAQEQTQDQQQNQEGLEFSSAEEMLRWDAAQTPPPPGLGERVMRAIEAEPKRLPWWKRWFS